MPYLMCEIEGAVRFYTVVSQCRQRLEHRSSGLSIIGIDALLPSFALVSFAAIDFSAVPVWKGDEVVALAFRGDARAAVSSFFAYVTSRYPRQLGLVAPVFVAPDRLSSSLTLITHQQHSYFLSWQLPKITPIPRPPRLSSEAHRTHSPSVTSTLSLSRWRSIVF